MEKRGRDKLSYTLIAIFALLLISVGVYAYNTNSPSIMGHTLGEIAPPSGCSAGQSLTWTGSAWACQAPTLSGSIFSHGALGQIQVSSVTSGTVYVARSSCPYGANIQTSAISGTCYVGGSSSLLALKGAYIEYDGNGPRTWICVYVGVGDGIISPTQAISSVALCAQSSLVS